MRRIQADIPSVPPPTWAFLERSLIDVMSQSVYPFLEKYTRPDGSFIWRDETERVDDLDDAYESVYNWPLLYALGGADHLLTLSQRLWNAITRQWTKYGQVHKEYEVSADWFHQGEGYVYFYLLGLADPTAAESIERARRFAGFYLNEDPDVEEPVYDPERSLIRSWHVGSTGADFHVWRVYGWAEWSRPYGLPYEDLPGITSYEDLKDPENARRMGEAMHQRMDRGDVAANLAATSLITNAYLYTGDEKYRRWVIEYVEAWMERTRRNNGIIPDNVGLSGRIGEYMDGKWWGGGYGWRMWHGFLNIGTAVLNAALNALLLTGDRSYLELPRSQIDLLIRQGTVKDGGFNVPYKHGDRGWFEYQETGNESHFLSILAHLWGASMDPSDWERIERLRALNKAKDWNEVATSWWRAHCNEAPWLRFIAGDNPDYPERALLASLQHVYRRLDLIRNDREDLTKVNVHHWQVLNPVTTEALVQLTLGAPGFMYFGGLPAARVRYFDPQRRRPGLPQEVAALVEGLEADRTVLTLVNLNPQEAKDVIVQAGTFAEHRFTEVTYQARDAASTTFTPRHERGGEQPDPIKEETLKVDDKYLHVHLLPGVTTRLKLGTERFVNRPTYALPW